MLGLVRVSRILSPCPWSFEPLGKVKIMESKILILKLKETGLVKKKKEKKMA